MIRVMVGYDNRQPVAAQIAAHSVQARASRPVAITRLHLPQLPITRRGLTAFTYSRFIVPWLCDFEGYAIFIDSDMLCRGDVVELQAAAHLDEVINGAASVWVVPHEKVFERPSVMVFDCSRCKVLTPDYVQDPDNPLFDFSWADRVGPLPKEWNHLVSYDAPNPNAKMVHFTKGVPLPTWPTEKDEFYDEWLATARESMSTCSYDELMGRSVHVAPARQS